MLISFVVAVGENNAIGAGGDLLWRLPKDMQYFKQVTWGHHVLMGRKTYESIPAKFRPLPGRPNLVVTTQPNYRADGCAVLSSIDAAINLADGTGDDELMVIGGGEIYKTLFDKADKIYLTRVHHSFENADTFFPEIKSTEWNEEIVERHPADEKHKYAFDFVTLTRK